jgi:hypothetical protein
MRVAAPKKTPSLLLTFSYTGSLLPDSSGLFFHGCDIVGGDDDDDDDENDDGEDGGDEVVDDVKFCSPESMHDVVDDDDDGDDGDDEDACAGGVDEIILRRSKTGEIGSSSLGETLRRGLREKTQKNATQNKILAAHQGLPQLGSE